MAEVAARLWMRGKRGSGGISTATVAVAVAAAAPQQNGGGQQLRQLGSSAAVSLARRWRRR